MYVYCKNVSRHGRHCEVAIVRNKADDHRANYAFASWLTDDASRRIRWLVACLTFISSRHVKTFAVASLSTEACDALT